MIKVSKNYLTKDLVDFMYEAYDTPNVNLFLYSKYTKTSMRLGITNKTYDALEPDTGFVLQDSTNNLRSFVLSSFIKKPRKVQLKQLIDDNYTDIELSISEDINNTLTSILTTMNKPLKNVYIVGTQLGLIREIKNNDYTYYVYNNELSEQLNTYIGYAVNIDGLLIHCMVSTPNVELSTPFYTLLAPSNMNLDANSDDKATFSFNMLDLKLPDVDFIEYRQGELDTVIKTLTDRFGTIPNKTLRELYNTDAVANTIKQDYIGQLLDNYFKNA